MSKKTGYLFGILLTIILGTILYYFLCCNHDHGIVGNEKDVEVEKVVAEPEVKSTTRNAFSIVDSSSSSAFNANDNFNFKTSGYTILEPVTERLDEEVANLSTYIKENPNKSVNITGYYRSSETNNSAFPNLGIARANAIKNYFVSKGVSSKIMNTYGELNDDLVPDADNINYGPIKYSMEAGANSGDDLATLRAEIQANPLILYFDTAQATINLTADQRDKVSKISRYMDKADNAMTNVVGHTDNTSGRAGNIRLGKKRAEFAKSYLAKNGINSNKIRTSSKGPDQPIADNATEDGRAKNRRVVVTIN